MFSGGKCEKCSNLHSTFLIYWDWDTACIIVKKATGQMKKDLMSARDGHPVQLFEESACTFTQSGFHYAKSRPLL